MAKEQLQSKLGQEYSDYEALGRTIGEERRGPGQLDKPTCLSARFLSHPATFLNERTCAKRIATHGAKPPSG